MSPRARVKQLTIDEAIADQSTPVPPPVPAPLPSPPPPPVPAPPVAAEEPVFVARRPMNYEGRRINPGEVVPGAFQWPRIESWVRAGYLKEQT